MSPCSEHTVVTRAVAESRRARRPGTSWPVLISDKPSDNGFRRRQTERDTLRGR